jgi:hypothetical protein
MSQAALYRSVEREKPTLLLDEASWITNDKDARTFSAAALSATATLRSVKAKALISPRAASRPTALKHSALSGTWFRS